MDALCYIASGKFWSLKIKLGGTYYTVNKARSSCPLFPKVIMGQLKNFTDLRIISLLIILIEKHPVPYINLFLETRTKVECL